MALNIIHNDTEKDDLELNSINQWNDSLAAENCIEGTTGLWNDKCKQYNIVYTHYNTLHKQRQEVNHQVEGQDEPPTPDVP